MDVPCMAEHSAVSCFQHVDHLLVSMVPAAHCKEKPLWPKLTVPIICNPRCKYLDNCFTGTLCPLANSAGFIMPH